MLLKPASLDPTEWELMQTHTTVGATVLSGSRSSLIRLAELIALTHHEWWDGSGYPAGMHGRWIPLEARLLAVADAFDAMTSLRPYRHALTPARALREIDACSGTQFDPSLAALFVELWSSQPIAATA